MMITLTCSMCANEKQIYRDSSECNAKTTLAEIVAASNWFWQQNGEHFDTYCSEQCAA